MRTIIRSFVALLGLIAAAPWASAQSQWVEGRNYFVLQPAQPTTAGPGKIEVTEVFSYACPACNAFHVQMDQLQASLPANVVVNFVPASFSPAEDWPMFQRAFLTAQVLGLINKRTSDAMYDAVWKTGELATMIASPNGERLKVPAPTIADAAQWYARQTGVNPQTFLQTASSFGVDSKMRQADQYAKDCGVDQTPTIIVDGRYRITGPSAGSYQAMVDITKYLVAKLSHG
jgi:thiol:disulfide interchange protein DsbA